MHVVLIGPSPPLRGGIAAHTRGLREALERAGHRVDVVSYSRLYPASVFPGRSERDRYARVTPAHHVLDALGPRSWLAARRMVRSLRPDVILAQWWHPLTAAALLAVAGVGRRSPLIVCCHNATPHERFPGAALLSRWALSSADGFLCHSSAVRAVLHTRGLWAPSEVATMPRLIEAKRPGRWGARLRAAAGVAEHGALVVLPGNIRAYKGVELLVAAWARARPAGIDRLVLAGECYLERTLLECWLRRSGCADSTIVIDRYLTDDALLAWIDAADVVVFPYLTASQSGMLPVALAARRPVIVSTAGGLVEQARAHAAPWGAAVARRLVRVVQAGDADALSATLAACLDEARGGCGASRYAAPPPSADGGWGHTVEAFERLHRRLTRR